MSESGPPGVEVVHLALEEDSATLVLKVQGDFDLLPVDQAKLARETIRKLTGQVASEAMSLARAPS